MAEGLALLRKLSSLCGDSKHQTVFAPPWHLRQYWHHTTNVDGGIINASTDIVNAYTGSDNNHITAWRAQLRAV
jgi:hypothetical protein